MKYLALPLVILCLSACGTTSTVSIRTQVPDKTDFVFQDDRPADQKLSRILDSAAGQNSYFGDDNLTPSPPQLFRSWLHNQLASELKGKQVSLGVFTINVYDPAVSIDSGRVSTAAMSTPGGAAIAPLAGLFIHGMERMRSEKVVQVKIQGKIQGVEFSASETENFRGRVTEANLHATIVKTLDRAMADVKLVVGAQAKAIELAPVVRTP